jgi:hypothetical protein
MIAKAYAFMYNEDEGVEMIVYAENANKAKADSLGGYREDGQPFCQYCKERESNGSEVDNE